MKSSIKLFTLSIIILFTLGGCLEDDEPSITSSITVPEQTLSQNLLYIQSFSIDQAGWIVVHADNGNNGPQVPEIISNPVQVQGRGTYQDVLVQFTPDANLTDGGTVWPMLHQDTGNQGEYEFDGQSGDDPPVQVDGQTVTESVTINAPSIQVSDQAIDDNQITVDEAIIGVRGWVAVHVTDEDGNPGAVVGTTELTQANNTGLNVQLDDSQTYNSGDVLIAMLHIDRQPLSTFNFPDGDDVPEVFGFDDNDEPVIVLDSFTVQ